MNSLKVLQLTDGYCSIFHQLDAFLQSIINISSYLYPFADLYININFTQYAATLKFSLATTANTVCERQCKCTVENFKNFKIYLLILISSASLPAVRRTSSGRTSSVSSHNKGYQITTINLLFQLHLSTAFFHFRCSLTD